MITQLLTRIQNGNLEAFWELYDRSYEKVYRFIYHRTNDHERSEDIVADTYMKAMKRIRNFRGTHEGEFFSWIYRIAYTTLVDQSRSTRTTESLDDVDVGYTPNTAKDLDTTSRLEEVMNFLQTLSEKERTILTMRIWDDLSYAEISEITGESVDNSKKIVSRTLAKIHANIASFFIFSLLLYVINR